MADDQSALLWGMEDVVALIVARAEPPKARNLYLTEAHREAMATENSN